LGWLESLARSLAERGAGHLWLDELWMGLLPEGASRAAQHYRAALSALRRGVGQEARLAGLAAPFAASAGLLDALQLGSALPARRRFWRAARERNSDLALRAGLAGRIAHADSPALDLAGDPAALRRGAILAAICGGNVCLAGDPARISDARWRLARRLIPPSGSRPRRIAPLPGALAAAGSDGSWLVALLDAASEVALGPFGEGPMRVFDAWLSQDRGSVSGALELATSEREVTQLLRLSPLASGIHLVGSSLHLAAGLAEVTSCVARADGLELLLELPGPRQGSIYFAHGEQERVLRVRVAFSDRLELVVAAARVPEAQ
jgi:hypothetical protein